jgi:hypothetical protein
MRYNISILGIFLLIACSAMTCHAGLSGYTLKEKFTVTGSSGMQAKGVDTGYQISVVLHAGSGTNSAGHIYLGGACTDFPNDIRFLASDDAAALNYYVQENVGDAATKTINIQVAESIEAKAVDVYLYAGKSGVSSTSSGSKTFEFFDDFNSLPIIPRTTVYTGSTYPHGTVGGIQMPNGDLFLAWQFGAENSNNGSIIASRSTDGGATWSAAVTLQDTANKTDWEPQFLVSGSTAFFYYTVSDDVTATDIATHIYYRTSADSGATWSSATEITGITEIEHWTIQNPIVKTVAPNIGRIILPIYERANHSSFYTVSSMYSDDNGATWSRGGTITKASEHIVEPSITELSTGALYAVIRRYSGGMYQYQSTSTDGGATWSAVSQSPLVSSNSQAVVQRLPNGHHVALWNNVASASNAARSPLTIAVSTDNCASWLYPTDLNRAYEPTKLASNMGLFTLSDGSIIAGYDKEDGFIDSSATDIYVSKFTESDIRGPAWTLTGNAAAMVLSLSGNTLTDTTTGNGNYFKSASYTSAQNVAMLARVLYQPATSNYNNIIGWGVMSHSPVNTSYVVQGLWTEDQLDIETAAGAATTYSATGYALDSNYHLVDFRWLSSAVSMFVDDAQFDNTLTTNVPSAALPVTFGFQQDHPSNVYVSKTTYDWLAVRKLFSTEPTIGIAVAITQSALVSRALHRWADNSIPTVATISNVIDRGI